MKNEFGFEVYGTYKQNLFPSHSNFQWPKYTEKTLKHDLSKYGVEAKVELGYVTFDDTTQLAPMMSLT